LFFPRRELELEYTDAFVFHGLSDMAMLEQLIW
jgi:hypothetical protein